MIEKERAIRILEAMRTNWDENSKCPNAHALDMAIKSLKSKTYEDAIDEFESAMHDLIVSCGNFVATGEVRIIAEQMKEQRQ